MPISTMALCAVQNKMNLASTYMQQFDTVIDTMGERITWMRNAASTFHQQNFVLYEKHNACTQTGTV